MTGETQIRKFREIPIAEWPDRDRLLWNGALAADDLEGSGYGLNLAPQTLEMSSRVYGSWLDFLASTGSLDPASPPGSRVTRTRVRAYLKARRAMGNKNNTLITRLACLRRALRIIAPNEDHSWLVRSISAYLPVVQPPVQIFDSKILYEWGVGMMVAALKLSRPDLQLTGFRNGLLIAMLAANAPRLASIAAFTLSQHVTRDTDHYKMVLEFEDNKTPRVLIAAFPTMLTPYIDYYLATIRPALLGEKTHDWFWVTRSGDRWDRNGIRGFIPYASFRRFGVKFGTHRFRHCLATTAALNEPGNPGIAAAALGISARVMDKHYDRSGRTASVQRFHASLRSERSQTWQLARRLFRSPASS